MNRKRHKHHDCFERIGRRIAYCSWVLPVIEAAGGVDPQSSCSASCTLISRPGGPPPDPSATRSNERRTGMSTIGVSGSIVIDAPVGRAGWINRTGDLSPGDPALQDLSGCGDRPSSSPVAVESMTRAYWHPARNPTGSSGRFRLKEVLPFVSRTTSGKTGSRGGARGNRGPASVPKTSLTVNQLFPSR